MMRFGSSGWRAAIVLFAVVACGQNGDKCEVQVSRSAIVRGTADADFLGLSRDQAGAIGFLRSAATPEQTATAIEFCSVVRISAEWFVTAAHCLSSAPSPAWLELGGIEVPLSLGPDSADGSQIVLNADADVALLRVASLPGGAVLSWASSPQVGIDDSVLIAGAGDDGEAGLGNVLFAVAPVADVTDTEFTLRPNLVRAPCAGDSGGPALVRASSGAVVVAGVLSRGSPSCTGADVYERLDSIADWLQQKVGETSSTPSACETLGSVGRCYRGVAVWCEQSVERGERCVDACGWDAASQGYRCIAASDDPCEGISDLGACAANNATRCVSGRLEELACDTCGAVCTRSSVSGFATCTVTGPHG